MLLGDNEAGKSHLLSRLGISVCQLVLWVLDHGCITGLRTRCGGRQAYALADCSRYGNLDLLCIDETSQVHLDARGADIPRS